MIKDLVCFECPIVSFIKVYDSIFYSLLTSESERSTLLLLEFQELVTAAPRVRALSVHLQPRVQLLLLRHGTRHILRHSRRRRFLLYSSSGLVFLSSNLFKR